MSDRASPRDVIRIGQTLRTGAVAASALLLTHQSAELLGGRLDVTSEVGVGTTFTRVGDYADSDQVGAGRA